MIARIIELSAKYRWFVLLIYAALVTSACITTRRAQLDAIPDLSDPQVIIFTEWKGRSPTLVEDQVTYPIASSLLAAPHVTAVRGYSMFGMSFVYVLFDEGTDVYWARSRVLEYLNGIRGKLPDNVAPVLGPDATGIGWVYEYRSSARFRTSRCATRSRACPASRRSRPSAATSASIKSRSIPTSCALTSSRSTTSRMRSVARTASRRGASSR
jgi:Cu/Ag efflux pump CusA